MKKFEELRSLLVSDRSTRIFDGSKRVGSDTLRDLVDLTRYCASGRNIQPLKYRLVTEESECAAVYETLKWAGYYTDWDGPDVGHRPTAYLVQCLDTEISESCLCDDGLQLQAISLGATAIGLSGCIVKAFNATQLAKALNLPEQFAPRYVYALGYGEEHIELEPLDATHADGFKYHRLADGTHVVPKRSLEEIIIK